jgi:hypothetical protein
MAGLYHALDFAARALGGLCVAVGLVALAGMGAGPVIEAWGRRARVAGDKAESSNSGNEGTKPL